METVTITCAVERVKPVVKLRITRNDKHMENNSDTSSKQNEDGTYSVSKQVYVTLDTRWPITFKCTAEGFTVEATKTIRVSCEYLFS